MSTKRFLLIGNQAQYLVNFRGVLLNDIHKLGYETHAAAPDFDLYPEAKKFLQDRGIRTHRTKFNRSGLNPLADLWAFLHLFLLMRDLRPDLVLSYTVKPVIWGSLAGYLAQVPHRFALITGLGYAFTGNLQGKRRFITKIVRSLYNLALTKVNQVFFQNPDDEALFRKERILPTYIPSCVVNGSGVDLVHFSPAPFPKGDMHFVMIARLLEDKGVREYVEAAKMVREEYPAAEFHLVGGLDHHNPDAIKVKEMKVWQEDGNIIWHCEVKDVRPYIADCHVFVLPSYREGTPRSVLEAMAIGRAIITTDAPGCRETVIEGKNGFLVPIADAKMLAEKVKLFLTNDSLVKSFGLASRKLAQKHYEVRKVNLSMLSTMGMI